jgi:NADH-quinone oxidoreductase subunit L
MGSLGVNTLAAQITTVQAATGAFSLIWLLIALPLLGATILLLGGKRTDSFGHLLGTLMSGAAFVVAAVLFFNLLSLPDNSRTVGQHIYDWVAVGTFTVPIGFQLDQLSMTFVLLITFVGTLIHIYSIGYLAHDPERRKFFAYLNLFVASMLLLVLANNYLLLYVGWEGVGLASYLLIGFWMYKESAAVASKKAFVVNRVGDMGLSIAIMLMFVTFGSVSFQGVFGAASGASETTMTWIGLALLLGACGKSAQFPLQSWLLDAMEGPTPVSALIHAATMVTAGVYLIVRSNVIFNAAPTAQTVVIVVGAITLLMGAFIGTAKDDIKKVLAGSTMSQIGYMVLAAGLGPVGYAFAIFHLVNHGFFKANMFLGAGSVMHANNDSTNMRYYGALRTVMKVTFVAFFAGYLAIMGIPPFSGFYSKDKIIEAAFNHGFVPGFVALIGAGVTGFYMTRLMVMTFSGKARWTDEQHPHESPMVMLIPIAILGLLSAISGFALAYNNTIENWLQPVTGFVEPSLGISSTLLSLITLVVVLIGVGLAWMQFGREPIPMDAPKGSVYTRAARKDLYGDAANEAIFMRPGQWLTRFLVFFDNRIVDGAVNGTAAVIGGLSGRGRRLQTGFARSYALSMLGGAALVAAALLLVRL